ncbi:MULTISPECIES: PIN domain-containing protein [Spirulina sp. CCY15215]|uniref:type II toxin-antitoxin system VapC family toxin n=1 Tax=Spirulina sp. CCY15215 TaxID=2767591 RepID=UPI00194E57A8|nr:PIN domain-containing protein [Spirulina major]
MAGISKILADTSGIVSMLDNSDRYHAEVVKVIEKSTLLIPTTILLEVDYLTTKYLGEGIARVFLSDVLAGNFTYLQVELADLQRALEIMSQYKGVPLGLVDSSIVALAERYRIQKILTLDRRHFSLIRPAKIEYLELLP